MTRPPVERRAGPDLWMKLLTWAAPLAGASLVAALCVTAAARPETMTFFDRFYALSSGRTWNPVLLPYLFSLLLLCFFSSAGGLIITRRRKRRKDDPARRALFIMLGVSAAGLIQYLRWMRH